MPCLDLDIRIAATGMVGAMDGTGLANSIRVGGDKGLEAYVSKGMVRFTGSNDDKDWRRNFDAHWDTRTRRFHHGFWKSLKPWLTDLMVAIRETNDVSEDLLITGHSKGGAEADIFVQVMGPRIIRSVKSVKLITFGQPRTTVVGQSDHHGIEYIRVVNGSDPVPSVPPWWMGYRHNGKLVRVGRWPRFPLPGSIFKKGIDDHEMENYYYACID